MAHKTKIDGTNYEISGGKTRVDGTNYKIVGGKTLVGGTAYEVGFAQPVTITLSGTGSSSVCYIVHNGTTYYDATLTPSFVANIGDIIHCEADGSQKNRIYLNGVKVADGGSGTAEYDYIVVSGVAIQFARSGVSTNYIYITET